MKSIKTAILFVLVLTSITSCRLLNSTGGSFVTATIEGEEFQSLNLLTNYTEVDSTIVMISASTGGINAQSIVFAVNNFEGEGIYELGGNSLSIATYADGVASLEAYTTFNDQGSGTLDIRFVSDSFAEGVFSFTASREDENGDLVVIDITDGEFGIER